MRVFAFPSVFFNTWVAKVSSCFLSPFSAQQAAPAPAPALTKQHLRAAKLCRDVYSADTESSGEFVESKDTGAQATVTLDGSQAIVCFRGSDSVSDWRFNFDMCQVPFLSRKHSDPDSHVHSGFFIAHNSIKAKIYAKLNAIVDSGKCESILFTGHSAGATLAKLCAYDFVNEKNLKLEIISFGSPKIGNAAFAQNFDADSRLKCTRVVNDNDGVALAPLFSGYHHVGELVRLRNVAPAQSIWHALRNFARLDAVADHGIDAYIATMQHWLKKDM